MDSHGFQQTRAERTRGAIAAIAVNALLGAAFVGGLAMRAERRADAPIETFDVTLAPPPPEPVVVPDTESAAPEHEGEAGRKTESSPVVAPSSPLPLPRPVITAPEPGTGSASSNGAASAGDGSGAGGRGGGPGGGGGIGTEARLLGGNRARLPSDLLRRVPAEGGYAHLLLNVSTTGRVTDCRVLTSSGFPGIDAALCGVMAGSSRWSAARDRQGNPIPVEVRYTATWRKN